MRFNQQLFYNNITKVRFKNPTPRQMSTTNYCLETIRKHDYENFICTLLLKKEARTAAIALRAFNVEIARLQDQVSNSEIGAMRFKFWEDAIQQCFLTSNKGPQLPDHPVVLELHRVLQNHKFTKRFFLHLITSRKDVMFNGSFANIEQMESYAEKSVASLYYLLLEGSDVKNIHADHAASHLGKAQGLCHLLRGVPLSRRIRLLALPQDLLLQAKISQEDVLRGRHTHLLKDVVFQVATRANQHLEKARSLSNKLSDDAKAVLLPATLIHNYLQRLLQVDCDLFHTKLSAKNYLWIPTVWFKSFSRTY